MNKVIIAALAAVLGIGFAASTATAAPAQLNPRHSQVVNVQSAEPTEKKAAKKPAKKKKQAAKKPAQKKKKDVAKKPAQ
ncbi:MAG: hypothetical protein HY057_10905 [Rhodospirillales bacterium]|nr:hypothetical protein [Rhodospirillales bacterium]